MIKRCSAEMSAKAESMDAAACGTFVPLGAVGRARSFKPIKSDLLNSSSRDLPAQRGRISDLRRKDFCQSVLSMTHSTISASSSFWNVRLMPICSTLSSDCLMPAVSMKRKSVPPMFTVSSIASRVVPCTSLTMAFSSPSSVLSRVDLPALVSPTMATGVPFLMALPRRNEEARRESFARISSVMS